MQKIYILLLTLVSLIFTSAKAQVPPTRTQIIISIDQNICFHCTEEFQQFITEYKISRIKYHFIHPIDSSDADYYLKKILQDSIGTATPTSQLKINTAYFGQSRGAVILIQKGEIVFLGAIETYNQWKPLFKSLVNKGASAPQQRRLVYRETIASQKLPYPMPGFNILEVSASTVNENLRYALLNMPTYSVTYGTIGNHQTYRIDTEIANTTEYLRLIDSSNIIKPYYNSKPHVESLVNQGDSTWVLKAFLYKTGHPVDSIGTSRVLELWKHDSLKLQAVVPDEFLLDIAEVNFPYITFVNYPIQNMNASDTLFKRYKLEKGELRYIDSRLRYPMLFAEKIEHPTMNLNCPNKVGENWVFELPRILLNPTQRFILRLKLPYNDYMNDGIYQNGFYYFLQAAKDKKRIYLQKTTPDLLHTEEYYLEMGDTDFSTISFLRLTDKGVMYLHADKRLRLLEFQLP